MSVKQRAYPSSGQLDGLWMHLHDARTVYNIGLEHRAVCYRQRRRHVSVAQQCRELTEARREFPWLALGSTVIQQGALRDLDRAFANFFAKRSRFPRFRSGKDTRQSFVVRDVTVTKLSRRWAAIRVPKIGWLKFRLTHAFPLISAATSARVVLHSGRWFVTLTTPPRGKLNADATAAAIGIDRGVANTVATSDGEFLQAPSWSPAEQRRYLALQQALSRCRKGSRRRAVRVAKLRRLYQRLSDRRHDWVEQTTTELALRHTDIAVERLAVAAMVRRPRPKPDPDMPGAFLPNGASAKAKLNAAIHASCWGKFGSRLDDKTNVVEVDPKFTSQQCNHCGHTEAGNRESQAVFSCRECGHSAHADVNAAMNIRDRAFGQGRNYPPGDTRCTGDSSRFANLQAA